MSGFLEIIVIFVQSVEVLICTASFSVFFIVTDLYGLCY